MHSRRSFLRTASASAFVVCLAIIGLAAQPAVRRVGRFYLVNGWILTADDVRALGGHAA